MIDIDESHRVGTISRSTCVPDESYTGNRSFLLCFDGSENAEFAFHWTIEHLLRDGDHLMLLHIISEPDIADIYLQAYDFVEDIREAACSAVC
jgi:hypothetical protein